MALAPGERFIDDAVEVYERVLPNLRMHRTDYPSPAALPAKIRFAPGSAQFQVPDDATPGQKIQLVRETTDNGIPPLIRYQRAVVSVTR